MVYSIKEVNMTNKRPLENMINEDARKKRTPLKIGLCLSGGAIRGVAHVGVLRVLYNEFVPIDFIAGSSAGSIVAGLYSLYGYHASWEAFENTLKSRSIFQFKKRKGSELFDSSYFRSWLKELFGDATFDDVKIPLEITALDIRSGKTVYISEGYLRDAIYASCAIPGAWKPAKIDDMILVDGSFGNDVPVDWLRQRGADIIIVSIVNIYNEYLYGSGFSLSRILKLMTSSNIAKPIITTVGTALEYGTKNMKDLDRKPIKALLRTMAVFGRNFDKQKWGTDADVKIVPNVGDFYSSNPGYIPHKSRLEFVAAGAIATWKKIPHIKYLLKDIESQKELSLTASEKIKKRISDVKKSVLQVVS